MRNQLMILFYVASIILSVNFLKAQQRQEMRQDVGGLKLFIEEFPKEFKMLLPWFTKDAVPASLIEAKDYINGKKKQNFPRHRFISNPKLSGKAFFLNNHGDRGLSSGNRRCLEAILDMGCPVMVRLWIVKKWKKINYKYRLPSPEAQATVTLLGYDAVAREFSLIQENNTEFVVRMPYDYICKYNKCAVYLSNEKAVSFHARPKRSVNRVAQTITLTPQQPTQTFWMKPGENIEIIEAQCQNIWGVIPECKWINKSAMVVTAKDIRLYNPHKTGVVKILFNFISENLDTSKRTIHHVTKSWYFHGRDYLCRRFSICREVSGPIYYEMPGTVLSALVDDNGYKENVYQAIINSAIIGNNVVKVYAHSIGVSCGVGYTCSFRVEGTVHIDYQN